MKIKLDDEVLYQLKDVMMVAFLKDDLDTVIKYEVDGWVHPDDVKYNKKLLKAYKRILDYYGEDNG
jgi:hypothetical protein